MSQNLLLIEKTKDTAVLDNLDLKQASNQLSINKLAVLSGIQEVDIAKMHSKARNGAIEKPKVPVSTNVPSWTQMKRAMIEAQLQELIAKLEAMQEGGGDYPIAYIIYVAMGILSTLSTQLQELTAKPLEHYQEISKRQAIVREKIEAIKKKQLANDPNNPINKEDVEGLQEALKELDNAVEALKKEYTFEDNDGNTIVIWPSDEVKDIYEKAKKNTDMMRNQKLDGTNIALKDVKDPQDMILAVRSLRVWAASANNDKPTGAFTEWNNGKDGAQGNSVMKIILETEISTYTDRLNRDAQLLASAQSMGQKQVEHSSSLMRGIVANYISR